MSDYNDGILPEPCLRMDTHFGDEYESIEFGDGTGYIKAAPILAKVGALHEEIDRLRDEEARLREEIRKHVKMPDEPLEIDEKDFYVRAFIKWATEEQPEVKRLEAENTELRKLVSDMWMLLCVTGNSGVEFRVNADDVCVVTYNAGSIYDRMSQLGIEVD